jgi:hypothetical protein
LLAPSAARAAQQLVQLRARDGLHSGPLDATRQCAAQLGLTIDTLHAAGVAARHRQESVAERRAATSDTLVAEERVPKRIALV